MLHKSITFGLLAAGLMILPTAAFAQQSQSVDQYTEQNGAATNGSTTIQNSTTNSSQVQSARRAHPGYHYGHGYGYGYGHSDRTPQHQDARQNTIQNGASTDGSYTEQNSDTNNYQDQRSH